MEVSTISRGSSGSKHIPFFPSLERLHINGLERLRGWWGAVGEGNSASGMPLWPPSFPRLMTLAIIDCAKLISLPPCLSLESLCLKRNNKALRILPGEGPANLLDLRVEVDLVGYLPAFAFRFTHIRIDDDKESNSLSEIEEVFKSSSSLRSLEIEYCERLTSVSPVLEHLTALESLSLCALPVVDGDFDDDMPWRSLRQNLRFLNLSSLDNLQMLPRGMKPALENLSITKSNSNGQLKFDVA